MQGLIKGAVEYIVSKWKEGTQRPESIFLIIVFAFLSAYVTWLIMEKIIIPSKILELNNKVIEMESLEQKMDFLKNENEELKNKNKKLKEEISCYSLLKATLETGEDFEDKALKRLTKNRKIPEKEEP